MNIGYNSLRFWLDLLLLPIINVVSVDLQLTIIIRNNTINLICLSNSSRNDIDIIGSKDNGKYRRKFVIIMYNLINKFLFYSAKCLL